MKPPIKNIPPELNRRLDALESGTLRQTIVKTIREIVVPAGGGGGDVPEPEPEIKNPPLIPEGLALTAEAYFISARVNPISLQDYPDFAGFEWHASITSGFTPDDTTFRGSGPTNRMMLHVPDCNITWYVKVCSYAKDGYYSGFCDEASILVPPPSIPTVPGDPVEEGDIVISGGITEINDCDTLSDWESEEADAIRLYAAEGGSVKEGTGALKIEIDKYGRKINTKGTSTSAPYWEICNTFDRKFVGQRVKSPAAFNVKRIMLYASKVGAPASPLEATLYSDAGGNPNAALGNSLFNAPPAWPSFGWIIADFAVPIGVGAGTAYWVELNRLDEGIDSSNYYVIKTDNSNPYEGEDYGLGWGTTDGLLNGRSSNHDTWLRVFSDQVSLNKHFKVKAAVLGTKDLTDNKQIDFWVCGSKVGANWLHASMGEAALGEQTYNVTVPVVYQPAVWNIAGIDNVNKDGIQYFGFKIVANDDQTITLYVDYIRSYEDKAVRVKFSDEVVDLYPAVVPPQFEPRWKNSIIKWDSGWLIPTGDVANTHQFDHNLGYEPDFTALWALGYGGSTGSSCLAMHWDLHGGDRGFRIVAGLNQANYIRAHAKYALMYFNSPSPPEANYTHPLYRFLVCKKTPGFNSGWVACPALGSQTNVAHGLGVTPDFYTLEIGHATIGGGYTMMGALNHSGNYPTTVCDIGAINITFSVGNVNLVQFWDYANVWQDIVAVANWKYRVKAWSWAPNYVSSWVAISTADRVRLFEHNLGRIPFLYLLEFSKAADGSNDIVPLQSMSFNAGDPYGCGTHLLWLDTRYATVLGGSSAIASYEDSGGVLQNLGTGFVRLKLWV